MLVYTYKLSCGCKKCTNAAVYTPQCIIEIQRTITFVSYKGQYIVKVIFATLYLLI